MTHDSIGDRKTVYISTLLLSSGIESEWEHYSSTFNVENTSVLVWIQLHTFDSALWQIGSELKGHWTISTSSPNFFQKSWDFYTIRSAYLRSDCMLNLTCNFNLITKIWEFFF